MAWAAHLSVANQVHAQLTLATMAVYRYANIDHVAAVRKVACAAAINPSRKRRSLTRSFSSSVSVVLFFCYYVLGAAESDSILEPVLMRYVYGSKKSRSLTNDK